jgi:hypothetical protein
MTRRLAFVLLALLVPLWLHAGEVLDRDILLAPDGTLYAVQTEWAKDHPEVSTPSATLIFLTAQKDGKTTTTLLPDSLGGGWVSGPVLAYDTDSDSLYVFWQRRQNAMASDMMLCTYQSGRWGTPTVIDSVGLHDRGNLRIAVTQKYEQQLSDGTVALFPALTVHCTWWDETGAGQVGRYAMVSIENGNVTSIQTQDLLSFVAPADQQTTYPVDPAFNREILRHPSIFETSSHTSVEIVFADWNTNAFHRVAVKPVLKTTPDGRLRIPVGIREGGFGPPRTFQKDVDGRINAIPSPATGSGRILFYFLSPDGALNYLIESGDNWSPLKTITTDQNVTVGAAVDALRRMIGSTE